MENSHKKILVIEDDEVLRNKLVDRLSISNYQVFPAGDGEEAVALLMDQKPNLILLDMMIPKLDGFKVLERLRHYPDKQISETKVIILSNLWSDKDILRAEALKIDEYYVKANTDLEDVFKRVSQLMAGIGA